jgi:hypothetical protein
MTDLTRQEMDAKLAASESKIDARLANFDSSIRTGFSEIRAELATMRADAARQQADARTDMANQRADFHKSHLDTIKWAFALAVAVVGATVGSLTYISKDAAKKVDTPAHTSAPPPIIITVPPGAPVAPSDKLNVDEANRKKAR